MELGSWIRRIRRGIVFRFSVVMAVVLFGFGILYGTVQIYFENQSLQLRLQTQASERAHFLSAVIPESVYLRDFLSLETLMRQTSTEENVVYAIVIDTDGRALTRYLNNADPIVEKALTQADGTQVLNLVELIRGDPNVREVRSSVTSEGLILGEVWLGYSATSIRKELADISWSTLVAALLASLLIALTTALLMQWQIRHPLKAVIDFSRALASGDMEYRVPITRQDELGSLAEAINKMADRLQETMGGLRSANQSLRSNEARTRSILTTAAEGIITIDELGIIESFNPAAARIFGYAPEEVIGHNVNMLMPEPYHSQHGSYISAYLTTGIKKVIGIGRETNGRHKNGNTFLISLSISELILDNQRLFTGIISDITERKRLEIHMEETARIPMENPNPILRISRQGEILFGNPASETILRIWRRDDTVHVPDDYLVMLDSFLETHKISTIEKAIGDHIYHITVAPVPHLGYVNLYFQNITESYHAQEVLAQERRLLRTIIDNIPDHIYVKDVKSRFKLINPAVMRALGVTDYEDIIGKTDFEFHTPELATGYFANEQRILNLGESMINQREKILAPDGENRWLASTKIPLRNQQGDITGLVGINRDITDVESAYDELRQVAEENQLLAQAVSAASDGIIITDPRLPDNPIIYANPAFYHNTGYLADEVIGRNCRFLQGPDTDSAELDKLRSAIRAQRSIAVTLLNYRKDGKPFWNELAISPVFSAEGELTNFVGIQTDSSERRQLTGTLQAVLDTVGEGIVSADSTGTIVMVNPEMRRIFGYSVHELLGQPLTILMPDSYQEAHKAGMKRYLDSRVAHVLGSRVELHGRHKDGRIFPLEIYISETRFADQHLFTASMRDITQRKEYDRMRDDFVSTVTHELRTPLASVMGWTETLLSGKPGPLTDLQKRFLGIVYDSSGRLNRLIEEILTVSRIQQGILQLSRQDFSPGSSLISVQDMMKAVAVPKQIHLEFWDEWPADLRMNGDTHRIEQVLINLIGNAIKFSPTGSTVIVTSRSEGDLWRVSVRDQGMGIPAADVPHIFERFYRATNASESQIQGTGLGLYVCQAIIEGHGGKIGIESTAGEGTTAWFTLPLRGE